MLGRAAGSRTRPRQRAALRARPGGLTNAPEAEPAPPEDDRPTLPIQYGVRVPTFLVSPWVPAAKGPAVLLDHCSILKTVLARFAGAERPFLSDRVAASHSFDASLTESQPRPVPPLTQVLQDLPISEPPPPPPVDLTGITTPALSRHAMREGPVESHELSGRLARHARALTRGAAARRPFATTGIGGTSDPASRAEEAPRAPPCEDGLTARAAHRRQSRASALIAGPRAEHKRGGRPPRVAQEMQEPLERSFVRPLQVVDGDQKRGRPPATSPSNALKAR